MWSGQCVKRSVSKSLHVLSGIVVFLGGALGLFLSLVSLVLSYFLSSFWTPSQLPLANLHILSIAFEVKAGTSLFPPDSLAPYHCLHHTFLLNFHYSSVCISFATSSMGCFSACLQDTRHHKCQQSHFKVLSLCVGCVYALAWRHKTHWFWTDKSGKWMRVVNVNASCEHHQKVNSGQLKRHKLYSPRAVSEFWHGHMDACHCVPKLQDPSSAYWNILHFLEWFAW